MPIFQFWDNFNCIVLAFLYNSSEQGLVEFSKFCGASENLQKANHDVIGDLYHHVWLSAWSITILTGADEAQHTTKYVAFA